MKGKGVDDDVLQNQLSVPSAKQIYESERKSYFTLDASRKFMYFRS